MNHPALIQVREKEEHQDTPSGKRMKQLEEEKSPIKAETSAPPLPGTSREGLPAWIFWGWGIFSCLSFVFLILAFWPVKQNKTPLEKAATTSVKNESLLTPGVVWSEDFEDSSLEDWVGNHIGIYEDRVSHSKGLFLGKGIHPAENFEFTPLNESPQLPYAIKKPLGINFKKSYKLSFDFSGSGPIELVQCGHIRLRLADQLPNLSYDPRGDGRYRSFNLPPWPPEMANRSKHHFEISVIPENETILLCINGSTIGHIEYADNMEVYPGFFIGELTDSPKTPKQGFIFYDNLRLEGTPTHPIMKKVKEKIGFIAAATPTAVPEPAFKSDPEYKKKMRNAWQIYNSGEFEKALADFQAVIKEYPQSAEAYNGMGLCHKSLGDKTAAWKAWIESLSIDSTYAPARQNLGM
jgi:hypothetical protein